MVDDAFFMDLVRFAHDASFLFFLLCPTFGFPFCFLALFFFSSETFLLYLHIQDVPKSLFL